MQSVSRLGVGLGYLGGLIGLWLGSLLLSQSPGSEPLVFVFTGIGFLLFALTAFALVRFRNPSTSVFSAIRNGWVIFGRLVRGTDAPPHMGRLLLARLFYTDAANTMIIFMALYATLEAGFTESGVQAVLLFGVVGAVVAAWPWGVLVDRAGPKNALDTVLLCWMFGLMVIVLVPVLELPKEVFYPLAFILGASLAGLWTADRPLLLALAPPGQVGESYGFYATVGRFTAIMGPLLWALMAEPRLLNWGRPIAVLSLLVFMILAFGILRRLKDPSRPDAAPLAPFIPWAVDGGRHVPGGWRRLVSFPFLLAYLIASWLLFVPNARRTNGFYELRQDWAAQFTYQIPELFHDPLIAIRSLMTAPWLNHDSVQLVYVTVLLALFGFAFEAKEGSWRTMVLFFATTLAGALVAGTVLRLIYPAVSATPFFERAWTNDWSGGSAGAFGLMGAIAARARRPWILVAFFVFWELNVGWWYLRSFTPAFHLTALATGFLLARYAWPNRIKQPVSTAGPDVGTV